MELPINNPAVSQQVEAYLNLCVNREGTWPDPVLIERLRKALLFRFSGQRPEAITNTYLKSFEVPQIVLFDILANQFPLVLRAQDIVMNSIISQLKGHTHVTIVDLGIGRGLQIKRLLEAIDHRTDLKSITVMGVEIMDDALQFTRGQLQSLAQTMRLKLEFIPFLTSVENMDVEMIQKRISPKSTALFINASLTLHHVQEKSKRQEIFQRLQELNPQFLTVIEPNTNTYEMIFEKRLFNAYDHFSALFAFTNSLDLTLQEKKGLKEFFSNDFFDPIAFPDSHRFERLDTSENWISIAEKAGFESYDLSKFSNKIQISGIEIVHPQNSYTDFRYKGHSLLGTLAFKKKK